MSERGRNEKDEKDEKGRNESWDEKWRRDPVEAGVWALILIWVGLVWLADSIGFLDDVLPENFEVWSLGFLGAGLIVIGGALVRLLMPAYRGRIVGSLIFGLILLGIGLGNLTNWVAIGALVLIGIGVSLLLGGLFRPR
jgi:hypothetical protein